MKNSFALLFFISIVFINIHSQAQNPVNWTGKQLMQPAELADILNKKTDSVTIISVGPGNTILESVEVGMASKQEGLDAFKIKLLSLKKDQKIVIYCGCCPFEHCPNVRPAIDVLKEMKFTNFYLLNLPDNIKKDWIDKGYPVAKS